MLRHKRSCGLACPVSRQGPVKKHDWGRLGIIAVLALFSTTAAHAEDRPGGPNLLSADNFFTWKSRSFEGQTQYTLMQDSSGPFVRADSQGAASARYRKQTINVGATPWLSWRWRLVQPVAPDDERSKSGDDFSARVYVVFASSFWPGSVRSLNYVWSHSESVGTSWPNPFTDKAQMIPLRQAGEPGIWRFERRNVVEDFRHYFGLDVSQIEGVAIMTDTDNSGGAAIADYASMRFSAEIPNPPD